MDQALTAAAAECGASEPAVRAAARSVPVSPAVIQVPACFGPTQGVCNHDVMQSDRIFRFAHLDVRRCLCHQSTGFFCACVHTWMSGGCICHRSCLTECTTLEASAEMPLVFHAACSRTAVEL